MVQALVLKEQELQALRQESACATDDRVKEASNWKRFGEEIGRLKVQVGVVVGNGRSLGLTLSGTWYSSWRRRSS